MLAKPGHALELEHVGELVRADPAAERVCVHVEVAHRVRQVRPHEQEPRVGLAAEQRHVVLAEHALGHVAHHEPGLGGERGRGARAQRAGERSREAEPLVEPLGHRVEDVRQRVQIHGCPLGAVDDLDRRRGTREREARVAGHRPLHLGRQGHGVERRGVVRPAPCGEPCHLTRQ
jgi:hypothetical protein